MSQPVSTADIRDYMAAQLESVFDTMLSMKAATTAGVDAGLLAGERVSGMVGLAGEAASGSVYLHLAAPFAKQAAATMLGLTVEEISGPAEVNDVIGEVTNMLAGGLKSKLCDAGAACVLTTPAIVHGTSYSVTARASGEIILLGFDAGGSRGLIEVYLKFK
jgi:chemotaxis protein CheX